MHYFCLLFSSGLDQIGDENDDDLCGFIIEDIVKEYHRSLKLKCFWCKKMGASVGCNVKQCRKTYHFPCSLQTDILNQYFGSFSSYCDKHRPKYPLHNKGTPSSSSFVSPSHPNDQDHVISAPSANPKPRPRRRKGSARCTTKRRRTLKCDGITTATNLSPSLQVQALPEDSRQNMASSSPEQSSITPLGDGLIEGARLDGDDKSCSDQFVICLICRVDLVELKEFTILRSECCEKAYYHRECIQNQAIHSGYLFQCPACCNKETFRDHMHQMGIYIPERDASWELEQNPYGDLYVRPEECSAIHCDCPSGNGYKKVLTLWDIVVCSGCGSAASHLACARLQIAGSHTWYCDDCKPVFFRTHRDPCFVGDTARGQPNVRVARRGRQRQPAALSLPSTSSLASPRKRAKDRTFSSGKMSENNEESSSSISSDLLDYQNLDSNSDASDDDSAKNCQTGFVLSV